MAKLQLSIISGSNERSAPLLDGTVPVEGVDLVWTESDASETFWRQLNWEEFQISEMSFSSLLIAKSHGNPMMAIPVFPSRRLMHTEASVHVDAGVETPEDLSGKRVGIGDYQQTSALWKRGVWEHDFGVSQYSVDWHMERTEELSHGGATGFTPPEGIKFHRIPEDQSLATMLLAHELDCAPVGRAFMPRNVVDRSTQIRASGADWSKVRPLFPDLIAEAKRFVGTHGFMPANHCYVIRGDVYEQYPWLAFNLYSSFVKAKELWYQKLPRAVTSDLFFGAEYLRQTRAIMGDDPFPYGVEANAPMMQMAIDFSYEQGLTPRKMTFEELFAPSVLNL